MSKNLLTIEAFVEWCERKPADEAYVFCDWKECACGQYAALLGIDSSAWADALLDDAIHGDGRGFWATANSAAYDEPRTFSALAKRLRSLSA